MRKFVAALIIAFALVASAEAKTYQHLKTVKFIIPDAEYTIKYDKKTFGQATFHYVAFRDSIKLARAYFKGLDPEFDINNYGITMEIDYRLPDHQFGYYDWKEIHVQSFDKTQRDGYKLFDRSMNYIEYVALLVHEISHAVLHQRSAYIDGPGHEYFAYCVMFDVAGSELVRFASWKYGRTGFKKISGISESRHDIDPPRFAIMSYWHRSQDGGKVFKLIWQGRFKSVEPKRVRR